MGGGDRHVDVMPCGGAADLAAVFVGPGRGVGQRFPRLEEFPDDGPRPRRESRLGQPRRRPMAEPSPRPGRAGIAAIRAPIISITDGIRGPRRRAPPVGQGGRVPGSVRPGPARRIAGTPVAKTAFIAATPGRSAGAPRSARTARSDGGGGARELRRRRNRRRLRLPFGPDTGYHQVRPRARARLSRAATIPRRLGSEPGRAADRRRFDLDGPRLFSLDEKGSVWRRSTPICPARAAAARSSSGAARRSNPTPSAPADGGQRPDRIVAQAA